MFSLNSVFLFRKWTSLSQCQKGGREIHSNFCSHLTCVVCLSFTSDHAYEKIIYSTCLNDSLQLSLKYSTWKRSQNLTFILKLVKVPLKDLYNFVPFATETHKTSFSYLISDIFYPIVSTFERWKIAFSFSWHNIWFCFLPFIIQCFSNSTFVTISANDGEARKKKVKNGKANIKNLHIIVIYCTCTQPSHFFRYIGFCLRFFCEYMYISSKKRYWKADLICKKQWESFFKVQKRLNKDSNSSDIFAKSNFYFLNGLSEKPTRQNKMFGMVLCTYFCYESDWGGWGRWKCI